MLPDKETDMKLNDDRIDDAVLALLLSLIHI